MVTTTTAGDRRPPARRQVRRAAALAATLLAGAAALTASPVWAVDGGIDVHSADMTDGVELNSMFACSAPGPIPTGGLVSPQLTPDLSGLDTAPTTLAIVMHDEFGADTGYDAGDWVHWLTYNVDPGSDTPDIPRGASQNDSLSGGVEGLNSWNEQGYRGPCPPPSGVHTYYFTVYALDTTLPANIQTADQLIAAMAGHIIDQGDLEVTFDNGAIGATEALVELDADLDGVTEGEAATLPRLLVNGVLTQPTTATIELNDSRCDPAPAATYGDDYVHPDGSSTLTVTIPAGTYTGRYDTAIQIPGGLTTLDDTFVEGEECMTAQLLNLTGDEAAIGDAGHSDLSEPGADHSGTPFRQAVLRIADNDVTTDAPASIEFAAANGTAAETAGGVLPLLLVSGALSTPVVVTINVSGGDATAGTDFLAPTTVTIPAGAYDGTTATAVAIPGFSITDDSVDENHETITFSLSSADIAALTSGDANGDATTQATLTFTITDDDAAASGPTAPNAPTTPTSPSTPMWPPTSGHGSMSNASSTALAATGRNDGGAPLAVAAGLFIAGGAALAAIRRRSRVSP